LFAVAKADRPGAKSRELAQLPDGVEHGAVGPLHHSDGTIAQLRPRGLAAADALDFGLDVLNGADSRLEPFTTSSKSWRRGLIAMPRSVTTLAYVSESAPMNSCMD